MSQSATEYDHDPRFRVTIDLEWDAPLYGIWPDGDGPENPTAEDVAEVMRAYGTTLHTMSEWCLVPRVRVAPVDDPSATVDVWNHGSGVV